MNTPASDLLLTRRTLLAQALLSAGVLALAPAAALAADALLVANVTGLYPVSVARIEAPTSNEQVAAIVRAWPGKVAIGGGRYSMGGQVGIRDGLHLDMRQMNRLIWIRPEERCVRVQSGMRWRDLQDILDPLNLAVKTMQSYSNFCIGGAVSVNAHGRYVGHGPVGNTVRALRLVLADGTVRDVSPRSDEALFRAAIGGYGAVGVITEVELDLTDNVHVERVLTEVPLDQYVAYFNRDVLADRNSVLHNADLLPPSFDRPFCVTWRETKRALTDTERLIPRDRTYQLSQDVIWGLTELPVGPPLRKALVQSWRALGSPVRWLNHEASLDVARLEPRSRQKSTYVLQEYFVPARHFQPFVRDMGACLRRNKVNALNVSIRQSPADPVSTLPWAKEDVFSFVLYYKQGTDVAAQAHVGHWTRELIDIALANEGRYYLPYQLHATRAQFDAAYPEAQALRQVKRATDPAGKFSNELWAKYL